ncbi:GMC family oxidoreductase [Aspergillus tanneri]|uniref:Glucose-methanol-choline oxidoreductase N-terminal domain-containing protein n=1 Tax=Aspergillus tanneri TaxID=1220188 RepID=A0A5M9MWJ8_9EURO|nr:uncharacterized protein ATNIH1004_000159 [Aspergillus tanneri]KAA8651278.1 hypothetical protein ATNIH1004_000159 [Aspergillus tanneri]
MFNIELKSVIFASLLSIVHGTELLGSSFGVPGTNATYDYVVVGGGTAGLTLATRLVQQFAGTVAVVEAGSFYEISNGNLSQVPALAGSFTGPDPDDWQPLIDWGYVTVPQTGAFNQAIHYAQGKTLGGSSARNFMLYQRGPKEAFSKWADTVGDESYQWDSFLEYFKKSVNFSEPNMGLRFANSTPKYDTSVVDDDTGPLSITFPNYAQAFSTWAVQGLEQIGIPEIEGFLSGQLIGQSYATMTVDANTMNRDSSETSFLHEGLGYPTLTVYPLAMAKRILFDGSKTATGVLVETQDFEYVLSARKEVLLSAGVFGSPQLLMASGVGPADVLNSLQIPIVVNRPGVGQGMQDHLFVEVGYQVNVLTLSALSNATFRAEQAKLYTDYAAGMFTSSGVEVLAWEKIPPSLRVTWSNKTQQALDAYPENWPEVEYLANALGPGKVVFDPTDLDVLNYASLVIALVTPEARGTVTIISPDTNVPPVIDPRYFTERSDIDIMVAGLKRARQFFETEAMKTIVIGDEVAPGKNVTTDAQIEDYIRTNFGTLWHAAGTCSMGKLDDPKAVIDAEARVIGVKGLRVVDISAFPVLPPGHPTSAICEFLSLEH